MTYGRGRGPDGPRAPGDLDPRGCEPPDWDWRQYAHRRHDHPWQAQRWQAHRRHMHRWHVRRSMHRRLFVWFGVVIAVTGATFAAVTALTGRPAWVFAFGAAVVLLWAASGMVAHRLLRPLRELVRVASDIGEGHLDSRARFGSHAPGELRMLADAINEMAGRIEQQLRDQRELLAAVSHEMRTPLGHLRVIVETGRERAEAAGADARMFEELEREVMEIDRLVAQLLASSRIDFGSLTLRPSSLEAAARQALERAGLGGDLLDVDRDAHLEVVADPTLLARALANLIDNAQRHGGGVRVLRVGERVARPFVEVEDAGPGFPPADLGRVFDPFFYRERTTGAGHGSLGLGLSLVRRIALAHGGDAYAENLRGGGARVGFTLGHPGDAQAGATAAASGA